MIHGDCKCPDCERERERGRKRGAYWLTEEGREEIRETWDGANDGDSIPRTLLDAVEARESDLAALRAAVRALAGECERTLDNFPDATVTVTWLRVRLLALLPGGDDASRE